MIQNCSSWKVLQQFLNNPLKKMHIREISRNVKLAPTSVKLHINRLLKENLIEEGKEIFKYYIANFDNERFRFYKRISTIMLIYESGLIDYLDEKCSPDAIMLFGSCAKGEDISSSDMDIFILGKEYKVALDKYEKILNKKIQLFFSKKINQLPVELRNNVLNGIKLAGYLKVF